MSRQIILVLFLAINFIGVTPVMASSFKAMPLRLYLNSKDNTEVLKVVNEGNEKVTVQVSVKSWSQDGSGKDEYSDTDQLIVFPKMTSIEAGAEKVFRVGYRGGEVVDEKTYRIFVQELPVNKPGATALKFALNLSLPVFVAPKVVKSEWEIKSLKVEGGEIKVEVKNYGNRHLMVKKITTNGVDRSGKNIFSNEKSGWYTLSGSSREYVVEMPLKDCMLAEKVKVEVSSKSETKQQEARVTRTMCGSKR